MSLSPQQYADLASHSYDEKRELATLARTKEAFEINGTQYKVLEFVDNQKTGYQGAIYQHVDSGAIVVAHRGTEFDREKWKDGVIADGGMVLGRFNNQAEDAIALIQRARDFANDPRSIDQYGHPSEVTVTGHSLGGTLGEITAHYYDLGGETFNSFGAASLNLRIPEGGNRVLNHVMAADAVSSASAHYGQVRIYATAEEIANLRLSGYHDNRALDALHPNQPVAAAVLSGSSHSMHNFLAVDGDGRRDRSVLADPSTRERADEHRRMIGAYRHDVETLRGTATVALRGSYGLWQDGVDTLRGPLPAGEPAAREERERAEREARPAAMDNRARGGFDLMEFNRQRHGDHGEQPVPPMLRRPEPGAPEQTQSALLGQLLDAAGKKDPQAIENGMQALWNSDIGQRWRAQAEESRQVLEAAERAPEAAQRPAPEAALER